MAWVTGRLFTTTSRSFFAFLATLIVITITVAVPVQAQGLEPSLTVSAIQPRVNQDQDFSIQLNINPGAYKPAELHLVASVREPVTTVEDITQAMANNTVGWVFSSSTEPLSSDKQGVFTVEFARSLEAMHLDKWESSGAYPMQIGLYARDEQIALTTVILIVSQKPVLPKPAPVLAIGSKGKPGPDLAISSTDWSSPDRGVASGVIWPVLSSASPTFRQPLSDAFVADLNANIIPNLQVLHELIELPLTVATDGAFIDDLVAAQTNQTAEQATDLAESIATSSSFSYLPLPYARADIESATSAGLYDLARRAFILGLTQSDSYFSSSNALDNIFVNSYGYGLRAVELLKPNYLVALEPSGVPPGRYPLDTKGPLHENGSLALVPELGFYQFFAPDGSLLTSEAKMNHWLEAASYINYINREPFVIALPADINPNLAKQVVQTVHSFPWLTMQSVESILMIPYDDYAQSKSYIEVATKAKHQLGTASTVGSSNGGYRDGGASDAKAEGSETEGSRAGDSADSTSKRDNSDSKSDNASKRDNSDNNSDNTSKRDNQTTTQTTTRTTQAIAPTRSQTTARATSQTTQTATLATTPATPTPIPKPLAKTQMAQTPAITYQKLTKNITATGKPPATGSKAANHSQHKLSAISLGLRSIFLESKNH